VSARRSAGVGLLLAVALAGCAAVRGDAARALAARRLMVPVAGVRPDQVPDTFADRRGWRRHAALDIPAPRGAAVVSADDGLVIAVRENRLGGRVVYAVDPDRRFVYYYAHLDTHRRSLSAGTTVARGEMLGTVGTTGNAVGGAPHLHFQVMVFPSSGRWWDGEPIDARPYLVTTGRVR
jgi:murein DD-endopeptidase MepM/ murein hydrolase activator NlpD